MSPENINNDNSSNEKEKVEPSISDIQENILENIKILGNIDQSSNNPINDKLTVLKEKVSKLKDNKEALSMVNEGLKKILDIVSSIEKRGKEEKRNIINSMITKLEDIERDENEIQIDQELKDMD